MTPAQRVTLYSVSLRLFLYTLAITGFALSIKHIVQAEGLDAFAEGHWVENIQALLLLLAALLFFAVARLRPADWGGLALMLSLIALFAVIREFDAFFDHQVPWFDWELPGTLVFLALCWTGYQHRQRLPSQLAEFVTMRGSTLAWAGFMLAIPLAQIVAHGPLFKLIMADDYASTFKRMIEEVLELVGYMMICFAAIEHFYQTGSWRQLVARWRR